MLVELSMSLYSDLPNMPRARRTRISLTHGRLHLVLSRPRIPNREAPALRQLTPDFDDKRSSESRSATTARNDQQKTGS